MYSTNTRIMQEVKENTSDIITGLKYCVVSIKCVKCYSVETDFEERGFTKVLKFL